VLLSWDFYITVRGGVKHVIYVRCPV